MEKRLRKSDCKSFSATIIAVAILMFIFFIPLISSFDFDNKIYYENNEMKVEVKNCALWALTCLVDGETFGTVELKSHNSVTHVKSFGWGAEEVVMYYDFEGWELYEGGLGEVEFIDARTNEIIEKDYHFVEWKEVDVPKWIEVCSLFKNETQSCSWIEQGTEKEFQWVKYDSRDVPARDVRIGLKTYVGKNDFIDGIWTIAGKKIEKHAFWTASLDVGLWQYWSFDQSTGTTVNNNVSGGQAGTMTATDPSWLAGGKLGYGINATNASSKYIDVTGITSVTKSYSMCFWIWNNFDNGGADKFIFDIENGRMSVSLSTNRMTAYTGAMGSINFSNIAYDWNFVCTIFDGVANNFRMYINGTQDGSNQTYTDLDVGGGIGITNRYSLNNVGANMRLDEMGWWNRTLSDVEIDFLYNSGAGRVFGDGGVAPDASPNVTLNLPANATIFPSASVNLNCTAWDDFAIVNVTLILDGVDNETNSTGINNSLVNFDKIVSITNNHNWTCKAYDNASQMTNQTTRFFSINISTATELVLPINTTNTTFTNMTFVVNSTATNDVLTGMDLFIWHENTTLFFTNTTTITGTSAISNVGINLPEGSYIWTAVTTGTQTSNRTYNRTFTTHLTAPTIIANYPTGDLGVLNNSQDLVANWTITEPGQNLTAHIDNCSLTYNSVTTYFNLSTCISTNETSFTYVQGVNSLSVSVTDDVGLTTTNTTSWTTPLVVMNQVFTTPASEGSSTTFTANVFTNGTDISLGNLSYNAQQNIGTITDNGGNNFTLTKTVTAPVVATDTNISFFWRIDQGAGISNDLFSQNQLITPISIDDCSTNTIVLYNFTMVDEAAQTVFNATALNTTGRIDLQLMNLDRSTTLVDFSTLFNRTNPFAVCLNVSFATGETFVADVQVEYNADTYEAEFYNIQNETITSDDIMTNITLYDLSSSNAQVFRLVARDSSFLSLPNAIIEVHRKYVDEGVFKIVEIPFTDASGETVAKLVLNDVIYNFIIKQFGETIVSANNVRVECQNPLVVSCEIEFNAFSGSIEVPNYETGKDFDFTLDYNSTSRVIRSIFDIPSGEPALVVLTVTREDALGTAVCTDSITSNLGTLTCVVPSNFGNATVVAKLTKDGNEAAKGSFKLDQKPEDIFGNATLFLALFAMLTLIGVSASDNPVFSVLFLMLGIILLFAMNLVANNGFIGASATILFMIMAIVIMVIKGAKRN